MNAQAYDGNTALHLAVEIRNPHITKLLVRSGADPDIENYEPNYRDEDETEQIGNSVYDLCDMHSEVRIVCWALLLSCKFEKMPAFMYKFWTYIKELRRITVYVWRCVLTLH